MPNEMGNRRLQRNIPGDMPFAPVEIVIDPNKKRGDQKRTRLEKPDKPVYGWRRCWPRVSSKS